MAAVTIRPATPADGETFLTLVDALADYEKLDRPTPEARQRLRVVRRCAHPAG